MNELSAGSSCLSALRRVRLLKNKDKEYRGYYKTTLELARSCHRALSFKLTVDEISIYVLSEISLT